MHTTPESRPRFQTTCFLLLLPYRYVVPIFTVSVTAADFPATPKSVFFCLLVSVPRKENVCANLSLSLFSWLPELFPSAYQFYIGQGETLPTQHKSWQPIEFDLTSVFQVIFSSL